MAWCSSPLPIGIFIVPALLWTSVALGQEEVTIDRSGERGQLTKEVMRRACQTPGLTRLVLDNHFIQKESEVGSSLRQASSLKYLSFMNSGQIDPVLEAAGQLPELVELDVQGCSYTHNGLLNLPRATKLRTLRLSGVNDGVAPALAKCQQITSLTIHGATLEPEACVSISELKGLTSLVLDSCTVKDSGMRRLLKLPNLQSLHFVRCNIPRESFSRVADLTTLTSFVVIPQFDTYNQRYNYEKNLSQESFEAIVKANPNLVTLVLRGADLTDATPLHSLKKLRELSIFRTSGRFDGPPLAAFFEGSKTLRHLNLSFDPSKLNLGCVSSLEELDIEFERGGDPPQVLPLLPNLKRLTVATGAFGNGGIVLPPYPKLESITFIRSRVNASAMRHIAAMPSLRFLKIDEHSIGSINDGFATLRTEETGLDAKAMKAISGHPMLECVDIEAASHPPIGDEGVEHLAKIPKLKMLRLVHYTGTSPDCLDALKNAPELTTLDIAITGLIDRDISVLTKFPKLSSLTLRDGTPGDDGKLTDKGMEGLLLVGRLQELDLRDSEITEVGFGLLPQFTLLRRFVGPDSIVVNAKSQQMINLFMPRLIVGNQHIYQNGFKDSMLTPSAP